MRTLGLVVGIALACLSAACATTSRSGRTPACAEKYGSCMSLCSQALSDPGAGSASPGFASPSCTDDCEERSKGCR